MRWTKRFPVRQRQFLRCALGRRVHEQIRIASDCSQGRAMSALAMLMILFGRKAKTPAPPAPVSRNWPFKD
jgi:hypothetical protein